MYYKPAFAACQQGRKDFVKISGIPPRRQGGGKDGEGAGWGAVWNETARGREEGAIA